MVEVLPVSMRERGDIPSGDSFAAFATRRRISVDRGPEFRATPTFTPEYVRNNTRFLDLTHNPILRSACLDVVADGYGALTPKNNPLTPEQVFDLLCKEDHLDGRAVTLGAVTDLPGEGQIITATMRFVFGDQNAEHPVEEMALVDVPGGWPNELVGDPYNTVATVGRYVVIDPVRSPEMRDAKIPGFLTGGLLREGFRIGAARNPAIEHYAAIMPSRVVRYVISGGIGVEEVGMRLKTIPGHLVGQPLSDESITDLLKGQEGDNAKAIQNAVNANKLFSLFPRYWASVDSPRLYKFIPPES